MLNITHFLLFLDSAGYRSLKYCLNGVLIKMKLLSIRKRLRYREFTVKIKQNYHKWSETVQRENYLIPWKKKVLHEKLTVTQLVKKFPAFHDT